MIDKVAISQDKSYVVAVTNKNIVAILKNSDM